MSNTSGLIPYIDFSKTAKTFGGPENYICMIRSSEYAAGLAEGLAERSISDFTSGLVTGCVITGATAAAVAGGIWLYKKFKVKKAREEYAQWNTN